MVCVWDTHSGVVVCMCDTGFSLPTHTRHAVCDNTTVCGLRENALDAIQYCMYFVHIQYARHSDYLLVDTHCNTLQHTATHCNTLQHTATQLISMRDAAWRGGISEVVVREAAPRT